MRKVKLDGGKYEFEIDEFGILVEARRNGEHWQAGLEDFQYSKAFMAALDRIQALEAAEDERDAYLKQLTVVQAECTRLLKVNRALRGIVPESPELGKVAVYKIRPAGEGSWLYVEGAEDVYEQLRESEPDELWEISMVHMTRDEIDALPEFHGW